MNKGHFKAAVIGGIGEKTEEMLDAAKMDRATQHGVNQVLVGLVPKLSSLVQSVDRDIEEGLYDKIGEPLLVAKVAKQYITRCIAVLESAAVAASNAKLTCEGRVQAIDLVVKNLKKEMDHELAKSRARAEVAEDEEGEVGQVLPDGSHAAPVPSLKAQRVEPDEVSQADVPKVPITSKFTRRKSMKSKSRKKL